MSTEERRAPGATRSAFDALVEVGGALGPTFEAQAVNVSEEGIQLRTAYLPEPGQPLTCRFDAGPGQSVLASGEVVWAQGAEKGGEFGVRFTDVDAESTEALKRVCGIAGSPPALHTGSKVRLHIDGLASPMRAKIKDAQPTAVTVGSDLGFLQVGRELELEDTQNGKKRPATVDRVEVVVHPASHVPQLVVTLRYADVETSDPAVSPQPVVDTRPKARSSDDLAAMQQASASMKGFIGRNVHQIGPALGRWASQAKTMFEILISRRANRLDDAAAARRTTAPPPGGGLHASGRRVVRGEPGGPTAEDDAAPPKLPMTGRRAIIAAGVVVAAIVGALAVKKLHHEPAPQEATSTAPAAVSASAPPPAAAPAVSATVLVPPAPPEPAAAPAAPPATKVAGDTDDSVLAAKSGHKKLAARVTPFANGPVHHPNVLHLKMDGPIETIEGAQQPTGFAIKIPGRKSLEAAAPLAARDSRIAAIKVSNDQAGAELTVAFRDGVPNYRVSARGDTLVIALAPAGALDKTAAIKDESGVRSPGSVHEHKVLPTLPHHSRN
jgi:PilZ domain